MDGESENPRPLSDRCLALSRRHFFGDFSLCQQRKLPAQRAEAFASKAKQEQKGKVTAFPPSRE
jgi:hypothetical protein